MHVFIIPYCIYQSLTCSLLINTSYTNVHTLVWTQAAAYHMVALFSNNVLFNFYCKAVVWGNDIRKHDFITVHCISLSVSPVIVKLNVKNVTTSQED